MVLRPGLFCDVAAIYLINEIKECRPKIPVRLFEGFVTFKAANRSGHKLDVISLRNVVRNPHTSAHSVYTDCELKVAPSDSF